MVGCVWKFPEGGIFVVGCFRKLSDRATEISERVKNVVGSFRKLSDRATEISERAKNIVGCVWKFPDRLAVLTMLLTGFSDVVAWFPKTPKWF
jgi:hypothetical protein